MAYAYTQAPDPNAGNVYWIGQDGNVYFKSDQGTQNMGVPAQTMDNNFIAGNASYSARRIDDPLAPQQAPSGGGGGSQFKDTTAQRNAAQAALDGLTTVEQNRLASERDAYGNLISQYDTERTGEQGKYNDQVAGNEQGLAVNNQAAMLAAAQGGRGLRATLAAMGALGGTGSLLADRAITDSANKDLGGARDNFETNAKTLQGAWGDFDALDKRRREQAKNTRANNEQAVKSDVLTQRQKLLQDMASYWEQAGNTGEYGNFMAQATSLTPQIAGLSRSRSDYTPVQGGFKPGELSNYLAGNRNMTVGRQSGAQGNAINSPLYAYSGNREEELV